MEGSRGLSRGAAMSRGEEEEDERRMVLGSGSEVGESKVEE